MALIFLRKGLTPHFATLRALFTAPGSFYFARLNQNSRWELVGAIYVDKETNYTKPFEIPDDLMEKLEEIKCLVMAQLY
jgi:hypothetical protein